jgi:cell division protein FtsB
MISNTEALVIGIMAIYTIAIVYGIHHYEAKIKKLNKDVEKNYIMAMEKNETSNQVVSVFQAVHEQNEFLAEQNQKLALRVNLLESEISDLRSGLHTGYPAPTVGSFSSMNSDTTSHYDKLQDVWSKGGMGIVNVDITNSNSNEPSE